MWAQIISKYPPTFLGDCKKAVEASQKMVRTWLIQACSKTMKMQRTKHETLRIGLVPTRIPQCIIVISQPKTQKRTA